MDLSQPLFEGQEPEPNQNMQDPVRMSEAVQNRVRRSAGIGDLRDNPIWQAQQRATQYAVDQFPVMAARDPDLAAAARQAGIDLDVAQLDRAKVLEFLGQRAFHQELLNASNPALGDAYSNPEFFAIAHDDAKNLNRVAALGNYWNAGKAVAELGALGVEVARLNSEGKPVPDELLQQIADANARLWALPQRPRSLAAELLGEPFRIAGQWWGGAPTVIASTAAGAAAGSILPGVGTASGALTGLRAGFMASAVISEGGNNYLSLVGADALGLTDDQAIAMGIDPGLGVDPAHALMLSTGVGVLNGALEFWGMSMATKLTRKAGGRLLQEAIRKKLAKDMLITPGMGKVIARAALGMGGAVAGEALTEGMQEVVSWASEEAGIALSPEGTLDLEGRPELLDRVSDVMAQTIKGMLLLSLPGGVMSTVSGYAQRKYAQQSQSYINAQGERLAKTRLAQRDKRQAAGFVDAAAEQSDVKSVFIHVADFEKLLAEGVITLEDLAETHPEVAQRLEEGRSTGVVEMPLGTYGSAFLASTAGSRLTGQVRLSPDGPSQTELAKLRETDEKELLEQAERVLEKHATDQRQWVEELTEVENDFVSKSVDTKTLPEKQVSQVGKLYSAFVSVTADALGMTPLAYHKIAIQSVDVLPEISDAQEGDLNAEGVKQATLPAANYDVTQQQAQEGARFEDNPNPEVEALGVRVRALREGVYQFKASDGGLYGSFIQMPDGSIVTDSVEAPARGEGRYRQFLKRAAAEYGSVSSAATLSESAVKAWEAVGAQRLPDGTFILRSEVASLDQVKSGKRQESLEHRQLNATAPPEFYSALLRAVQSSNTKAQTAAGWKQAITGLVNKGAVKADEVEWTALNDWLDLQDGKVTKEQVVEFLQNNGVQVRTVTRADEDSQLRAEYKASVERLDEIRYLQLTGGEETFEGQPLDDAYADAVARRYELLNKLDNRPRPKFGQYTLPGGKNYREVLLTLPPKMTEVEYLLLSRGPHEVRSPGGRGEEWFIVSNGEWGNVSYATREEAEAVLRQATGNFRSSHFDEPNIVAHLRLTDRVGPNGEKILFAEEAQSDWSQEGREEGFKEPDTQRPTGKWRVVQVTPDGQEVPYVFDTQAEAEAWAERIRKVPETVPNQEGITARVEEDTETVFSAGRTPIAPFVAAKKWAVVKDGKETTNKKGQKERFDSEEAAQKHAAKVGGEVKELGWRENTKGWLNLALKKLFMLAVEDGYDQVAFINGEKSVERYDLSKQVESITVVPFRSPGNITNRAVILHTTPHNISMGIEDATGTVVSGPGEFVGNALADVVGKELAERILGASKETTLRNADLEIGGEGMRAFYDNIVPQAAQKLVKKLGGKTTTTEVAGIEDAFAVVITDAMRSKVEQGLELFSKQRPGRTMGRYLIQQRIIELAKDPNLTVDTFVHELAHAFFFLRLAAVKSTPPEQRSPALQQMADDLDTLLQWFGIEGATAEERMAKWDSMTLDQQRKHHEAWAESFTLYVTEGRAPTPALNKVFGKLRSFLVKIWKTLRRQKNQTHRALFGEDLPIVTAPVAEVMDRMLAVHEAVQKNHHNNAATAALQTKEEALAAGMTEQEWHEYKEAAEAADLDAERDLGVLLDLKAVWAKHAKKEALRKYNRARQDAITKRAEQIREDFADDIQSVWFARQALTGSGEANKLNTKLTREAIAEHVERVYAQQSPEWRKEKAAQIERRLGYGERGALSDNGSAPEIVASLHGFDSVDAMIAELVKADDIEDSIRREAESQLMAEKHRLWEPGKADELVAMAIANEARKQFLLTELRLLLKAEAPAAALNQAAAYAAVKAISQRQHKTLTPHTLIQIEARASKALLEAVKSGDRKKILEAKSQQLTAHYLLREGLKIRDALATRRRQVNKSVKRSNTALSKTHDRSYVEAARALMGAAGEVSPGVMEKAQRHLEETKTNDPAAYAEIQAMLADLPPVKDYKNMTVEEANSFFTAVENLMWRGEDVRHVELEGQRVLLEDAGAQLVAGVEGRRPPGGYAATAETAALDKPGQRKNDLKSSRTALTQMEHLLAYLDSHEEGGPWLSFVWDPVKDALNNYRKDQLVYLKQLTALFDRVREIAARRRKANQLPNGKIRSDVLNYTFGNGNGGFGLLELVGALLHSGNLSNLERLLLGGRGSVKWGKIDPETNTLDRTQWDRAVKDLIQQGVITPEVMDVVQGIWDLMEKMKPVMQKAHRSLTGGFFLSVPADSFTLTWKDGTTKTYRGGYVPASPDPDLSPEYREVPNREEAGNRFIQAMPKTPDGMVKERASSAPRRSLSINPSFIIRHIDESMRFAHVQPAVHQVVRLINRPEVREAVTRYDPNFLKMMQEWLERVTQQSLVRPGHSKVLDMLMNFLRRNSGVAAMMLSPVNTLQQLTGISNSFAYVKTGYMANAFTTWMSGGLGDWIRERSKFMDERMSNQLFSQKADLQELVLDNGWVTKAHLWTTRHAYFLQGYVQNAVDSITWKGAYEQEMAEAPADVQGEARELRARKHADRTVRLAQGSFDIEDVAAYQAGTPFHRTMMQFSGYFNTVMNQMGYRKNNALRAFLLTVALPSILSEAIGRTIYDRWDDDDEWGLADDTFYVTMWSQLRAVAAMVPVLGPAVVAPIDAWVQDRPVDDRPPASPAVTQGMRSLKQLVLILTGEVDPNPAEWSASQWRSITNMLTMAGIPAAPLYRIGETVVNVPSMFTPDREERR